jgi:CheY-like chemotaxis protein
MKEILIVDDDVTFLKMIRRWLDDKYQVTAVKSGEQALKYLAGHKPDLILLDYLMPGITGADVLRTMRETPENLDIPVVFLTGKNDEETRNIIAQLKPQGCLDKTMERESILSAVDKTLADGFC